MRFTTANHGGAQGGNTRQLGSALGSARGSAAHDPSEPQETRLLLSDDSDPEKYGQESLDYEDIPRSCAAMLHATLDISTLWGCYVICLTLSRYYVICRPSSRWTLEHFGCFSGTGRSC